MGRWYHGSRRWSVYTSYCRKGGLADDPGSGLGALATLLETKQKEMFPNLDFPKDYNTAVLKAAYIFSYLT